MISRLDYGKKYCTESITVDEQALQRAIVRALNRFNVEDEATYLMLIRIRYFFRSTAMVT